MTEQRCAVAYLRVSTDEQTVENQRLALKKYAEFHHLDLLDFFEDPAVSGRVSAVERKGFSELLDFIKENPVDVVLVYELSRIGRRFWETLDAIKLVDQYSALVSCSPKESFLQTMEPSVRKLMISILSWVAEREREMLVQRTKDGMERARIVGRRIGRPTKAIDGEKLTREILAKTPRGQIAKKLEISKGTLYKELNRLKLVKMTYR